MLSEEQPSQKSDRSRLSPIAVQPPTVSLPKGGGAIRGIGEKFSANPVTGTGSLSVPVATSPGRAGFGPQLSIQYDSGAGQGPYGLGWSLSLPSISRRTDRGLPVYLDVQESDVFLLAGAEELVPVLNSSGKRPSPTSYTVHGEKYLVCTYIPRIEGAFALIERWTQDGVSANSFWRTISHDNVTSWYGRTTDSRVADASEPSRVFQWLLCENYDDKGNAVIYTYLPEDSRGIDRTRVAEANRLATESTTQRYVHRIRYGNTKPHNPTLASTGTWTTPDGVSGQSWMFEVVFDYGQCDPTTPLPTDNLSWSARQDPFSSYRSGFEIRTWRRCRRVLMFHHFPNDTAVGQNCLVRSTVFQYREPTQPDDPETAGYTVLQSVSHRSHQRNGSGYESRQAPPVDFRYSEPVVNRTEQTIASEQLENLPVGTQGFGYQWVDLDGEGLSGVLTEQAGAWFYKCNLGGGRFGPMQAVARAPAMASLSSGRQQFMDLTGDGHIELVDFTGSTPGYQERSQDEQWGPYVPFASLPNIDWKDFNLRFVDLTGDGHADVLITEDDIFTWHASLAERGFDAAVKVRQSTDEEAGPRVVFADELQTVFLADMSGDGLIDLVRIRNSEISYWPSFGYGRFGRKVTLDNSPVFDHPDAFDPRRIRLSDVDGSGPVDIIYLGRDGARLYFNRSGNSFSDPLPIQLPIATENHASVQVADLLGNGTACLVWNSHLSADGLQPVHFIDLMGGQKPHLLIEVVNNIGSTTSIEYTPSTQFYVQDKLAGIPWITRVPFPVHCVSRTTVRDQWRGATFSTSYSYHHGYFNGLERGLSFGRVEQVDTEHYAAFSAANASNNAITPDQDLYQAPVKTISWFHTGAMVERRRILDQFATEYFPARYPQQSFFEKSLPEPELDPALTPYEWREALWACKGMALRQETYELDPDELAKGLHTPTRIFSAAQHNCHLRCLQRCGENAHAVFLVTECEAVSYSYELDLRVSPLIPDPRIAHTLNLRQNEYGSPEQSIAIAYGRQKPLQDNTTPMLTVVQTVQSEVHIAYAETHYTNDCIRYATLNNPLSPIRHRRLRVKCEAKSYEITGLGSPATGYFDSDDLRRYELCEDNTYPVVVTPSFPQLAMTGVEYHEQPQTTGASRRIVERTRSLYFDDEDSAAAPTTALTFGQLGPRGLKYEDYKLALTNSLLDAVFKPHDEQGNVQDLLARELDTGTPVRDLLATAAVSGYVAGTQIDLSLIGQYWMRSGVAGFATGPFYLPDSFTDAFGNTTLLNYHPLGLYIQSSTDACGNTTEVEKFDFRVLAPREMIDANGNRSEVVFDIRGLVVAAAVTGKEKSPGVWEGDDLNGFDFALANPTPKDVQSFCTATTLDQVQARTWLGRASTRFVYHFGETYDALGGVSWAAKCPGACAIQREMHTSQSGGGQSPLQVALECSDGTGNVLMKKVQAESATANGALRWIVNGLTVLNNKGNVVKQYEPAFSDAFGCEVPKANGVSTVKQYDAAGRLVRIDMPDGTFSRTEFSSWHTTTYDPNDTVLDSVWYKQLAVPDPTKTLPAVASPQQRAAWLAARHGGTPSLTILDSLGRDVIAIVHNRVKAPTGTLQFGGESWRDEYYPTFTKLDAEGKPLWIRDARGNLVMQFIAPARANDKSGESMPSGSVPCYDIAGNLLFQHSMDAGDRWMLTDATGKPMLAWDFSRRQDPSNTMVDEWRLGFTEYDALHRPVSAWFKVNTDAKELLERFEYRDTNGNVSLDADRTANLIGQLVRHRDSSGLVETVKRDFKGNVRTVRRTLVRDAKTPRVDWQTELNSDGTSKLEADTYTQITEYDALNRMIRLFNWHRGEGEMVTVYRPAYGRGGTLLSEQLVTRATKAIRADGSDDYDVRADVVGPPSFQGTRTHDAIQRIRYNEKGQKISLELGNGTLTQYQYDAATFRLMQILTTRPSDGTGFSARRSNNADPTVVQQLLYTYDPSGNITEVEDQAIAPVFFDNVMIDPKSLYEYDALYRLTSAQGRETAQGGDAARDAKIPTIANGFPVTDQTLRNYTQSYQYDPVGNFVTFQHEIQNDTVNSWTRSYECYADSNRLHRTSQGTNQIEYLYDPHGNTRNLARTAEQRYLRWDHRDMIASLDMEGGGWAYYQYDSDKQRTRKLIKRVGNDTEERIYLGGFERYRRWVGATVVEEIESHHLFEGETRVLLIEDVLSASSTTLPLTPLLRYQYGNHLGSTCLELDETSVIISYEEFHPYGTSAYQAGNKNIESPIKRYRYTGMEKDDESGLNYHSARYCATSIAGWISPDPNGVFSGLNLFRFVSNNPVSRVDPSGRADNDAEGIKFQQSAPKINLLDDNWKLWNVGSHEKLGQDKFGNSIPVQLASGASQISEHSMPGAAIKWSLASAFGEEFAKRLYPELYSSMTTIMVPKKMADVKTLSDNIFSAGFRNAYKEGKSFDISRIVPFTVSNFFSSAEKAGIPLTEKAVQNFNKQLTSQGRQFFGALVAGMTERETEGSVTAYRATLLAQTLENNVSTSSMISKSVSGAFSNVGAFTTSAGRAFASTVIPGFDEVAAVGGGSFLAGLSFLTSPYALGTYMRGTFAAIGSGWSALIAPIELGAAGTAGALGVTATLAAGALFWAYEDTSRALEGKSTMSDVAADSWNKRGLVGGFDDLWWQLRN